MTDRISIRKQFGKQAKKIRLHYGLDQDDLASLSAMTQSEYSGLESGSKNYNVERLEQVSAVYGLEYYEIGNPKTKYPLFNKLPIETQQKIKGRKKPVSVYNELDLSNHLLLVLSKWEEDSIFTPSDIFSLLAKDLKEGIKKSSRITDLFAFEFSEYVEKTGEKKKIEGKRGRPEEYYRLIKKITPEMLKKTKEKPPKSDRVED